MKRTQITLDSFVELGCSSKRVASETQTSETTETDQEPLLSSEPYSRQHSLPRSAKQPEDMDDESDNNDHETETEDDDGSCEAECCNGTEPYQPLTGFLNSKKKQGKQSRMFQRKWFLDHKWLTYCTTYKVTYCFYCRKVNHDGGLINIRRLDHAFILNGFSNWKKAKEKFKEHEKSQCPQEACMKYAASKQRSVIALARSSAESEQKARRSYLLKQLSSIQYLVRQGLAIRGHCDIEGNLQQLMKCRSEDIPQFQQWIKQGKYQSPEIVNELISLMARQVLNSLLSNIRSARFYSLVADETRDVSGKEQLSVSIRWVNASYEQYEDFIGLVDVEKTDATTLKSTIKDVLLRCNIPLSNCRGQAYDGAANMAGHLNGVAVKIQSEQPSALFVHCLGHSVNLCLQECGKIAKCIRDAISVVRELYNIIHMSPKRLAQFNHLKAHASPNNPSLKPLCPTRWTVRTAAIDSVLKNYKLLLEELEVISTDSSSEASTKATGLIAVLEKFNTFFGLKLAYLVFVATEQLAVTLQAKDINAQVSIAAAKATDSFLERYRNLDSFTTFFHAVVAESNGLTSDPVLPRQKRVPKRIDDGCSSHQYQSAEEYFRQQYYEVLDIMRSELKRRFDQEGLKVLGEIENLISACNGNKILVSTKVADLYQADIDFERLDIQLSMLPDLVKTVNEQNLAVGQPIVKEVTAIDTLCGMMNSSAFGKSMLGEVDKLLHIYLTVPMTSATAERTFSVLRRLNTYLRATMSQQRLNSLMLLHAHKDETDNVNLVDVAKNFITVNNRRHVYFGNFTE